MVKNTGPSDGSVMGVEAMICHAWAKVGAVELKTSFLWLGKGITNDE